MRDSKLYTMGSANHIREFIRKETLGRQGKLCKRIHTGRSTLRGFLEGGGCSVDTVEALLNEIGYTLEVVPKKGARR